MHPRPGPRRPYPTPLSGDLWSSYSNLQTVASILVWRLDLQVILDARTTCPEGSTIMRPDPPALEGKKTPRSRNRQAASAKTPILPSTRGSALADKPRRVPQLLERWGSDDRTRFRVRVTHRYRVDEERELRATVMLKDTTKEQVPPGSELVDDERSPSVAGAGTGKRWKDRYGLAFRERLTPADLHPRHLCGSANTPSHFFRVVRVFCGSKSSTLHLMSRGAISYI